MLMFREQQYRELFGIHHPTRLLTLGSWCPIVLKLQFQFQIFHLQLMAFQTVYNLSLQP